MHIAHQAPAGRTRPKPFYRQLYFQVVVAILLGITVGHFWPDIGASLKPLGDAFVKLVKMIIAPVIFLTVTTGIAGMRDLKKVGRVAGKAFAYFLTFSTLALIVGLIVGNCHPARRRPQHRPGHARRLGRRRLRRQGARHDRRRLPAWASSRPPSSAPSPRATSCRCCSSRCSSASRSPRSASAASRCSTSCSR